MAAGRVKRWRRCNAGASGHSYPPTAGYITANNNSCWSLDLIVTNSRALPGVLSWGLFEHTMQSYPNKTICSNKNNMYMLAFIVPKLRARFRGAAAIWNKSFCTQLRRDWSFKQWWNSLVPSSKIKLAMTVGQWSVDTDIKLYSVMSNKHYQCNVYRLN